MIYCKSCVNCSVKIYIKNGFEKIFYSCMARPIVRENKKEISYHIIDEEDQQKANHCLHYVRK